MHALSPWVGIAGLLVTLILALIGVAFQMGKLTQRVDTIEKATSRDGERHDAVTRLEVQMEHMVEGVDALKREVAGVHRQLANIATGKIGGGIEFPSR